MLIKRLMKVEVQEQGLALSMAKCGTAFRVVCCIRAVPLHLEQ